VGSVTRHRFICSICIGCSSQKDFYAYANGVIKAAARENGIPLIHLESIFKPLCPTVECPASFFDDGHPKAPGYRIVAESVLERIGGQGPS